MRATHSRHSKISSCSYETIYRQVSEQTTPASSLPHAADEMRNRAYMRGIGHGGVLRPVYSDWDLAGGRAELLVQPAVRPYPHVVLRYAHLRSLS